MKFSVGVLMTIVLLFGLLEVDAIIRQRARSCYDCYGRRVRPGESYFDGCNDCICTSWFPKEAACTYRYCRYNLCYKPYGNLST